MYMPLFAKNLYFDIILQQKQPIYRDNGAQ